MPMYDFICPECGSVASEFRSLADWDRLLRCPNVDCRAAMKHDLVAQHAAVRGDYKVPIELQSMGFLAHPEDVAEHRRRFPNVELRMREGSAIPVMRNLAQKRAFLRESGWADTKSY